MRRMILPLAVVGASVALALTAGFPCSSCGTGSGLGSGLGVALAADPSASGERAPALKVGDAAPKLAIEKWVKGEAVDSFQSGKVYVVEFWATWCPPCREAIPHLTKLQKANDKDLVVIGVASSERKKDGEEGDKRLERLEAFVKKQGEAMEYRVGFDPDRKMGRAWLQAAGQNSIPCSFVVGADGKVAFIGNPLDERFEQAVEKALAGAKKS